MTSATRNQSKAGGSSAAEEVELGTPEIVRAKLNKLNLISDLDAFDNFLDLLPPAEAVRSGIEIVSQAQKLLEDDDDDSTFLSDSDDEFASSPNKRIVPQRGVQKKHSGDLERLFQKQVDVPTENKLASPPVGGEGSKKKGSSSNLSGEASKRSSSLERKPTRRRRDELSSSSSEHVRRMPAGSVRTRVDDSSKNGHGGSRTKASVDKTALNSDLRRRDELANSDHGRPRDGSRNSGSSTEDSTRESIHQALSGTVRSTSRPSLTSVDRPRRGRRDEMSQSEHVRPRAGRVDLYCIKTRPSNNDLENNRTNSEVDLQMDSAAARRLQGGAVVYHRRSRASAVSPVRAETSSSSALRRSVGQRGSGAGLSQHSPRMMRRSHNSTGGLTRSSGSRNSVSSMLAGVYSSPAPGTGEILKKSGGKGDIDDMVMKLDRQQSKTHTLQKMQGNAAWN